MPCSFCLRSERQLSLRYVCSSDTLPSHFFIHRIASSAISSQVLSRVRKGTLSGNLRSATVHYFSFLLVNLQFRHASNCQALARPFVFPRSIFSSSHQARTRRFGSMLGLCSRSTFGTGEDLRVMRGACDNSFHRKNCELKS